MLGYIEANSDVWLGWTWWAAGPWWHEYLFTLEPTNLGQSNQTDRPAMAILKPHFAPVAVAGDFNGNGTVDAADYVLWRSAPDTYGGAAGYDNWLDNFGRTAGSGSRHFHDSVPEPVSMLLLMLGAALGFFGGVRSPSRMPSAH